MLALKRIFIIYYAETSFKLPSFKSANSYLPPQPGVSSTGSGGNTHTAKTNLYALNIHELGSDEPYMGFSQLH